MSRHLLPPLKFKLCLVLLSLASYCLGANAQEDDTDPVSQSSPDRVVLQLGWRHQFQFAGYYAAKARGYYADAGLEVHFQEGGPGKSCYAIMMAGQADYCADDGDNIFHFITGTPMVALASLFQHSPVTLIARKDSGLETPRDLIGKRVESMHGGVLIPEIAAMFQREGISLDQVENLEDSFGVGALINGEVDAIFGYVSNEPNQLRQAGVEYNLIRPRNYGIDFYGDALFTTQREIEFDPERVMAFRAASIKGWEYAMSHPDEIIDLILQEYNPGLSKTHLRYEAGAIQNLMKSELVEVGHMNPARWRHMADLMVEQGHRLDPIDVDQFIFDPDYKPDYTRTITLLTVIVIVCGAGIGILLFFNTRLSREIDERRRAESLLEAANRQLEQLSITDGLTSLANRRRFDQTLAIECARANRSQQWVGLVMIDIDYFKRYNDHYGHQAGDHCLQKIAQVLSANARRVGDLAARYGGEEFGMVIAGMEPSRAIKLAEDVRLDIERLSITHETSPMGKVTVSLGLVVIKPGPDSDSARLIALADEALYRAKHNGRNRVEVAIAGNDGARTDANSGA